MHSYVKYLPAAALPDGGVADWTVADAERWRKASLPAALAPAVGAWVLTALVLTTVVLIAVSGPEETFVGNVWDGYPESVLLLSLPLWYWRIPAATLVAAPLLALWSALSLAGARAVPPDAVGRAAEWLLIGLYLRAGLLPSRGHIALLDELLPDWCAGHDSRYGTGKISFTGL
ncbi:hypothetical protein [Streptomyces sp. NPDC051211]|uniref:hypothetical protein n=1 Tax=Streptomyces sp. NPDC051211 TaxID=3154643 RepID=UPI00344C4F9C